jgi:hypothetical protein
MITSKSAKELQIMNNNRGGASGGSTQLNNYFAPPLGNTININHNANTNTKNKRDYENM